MMQEKNHGISIEKADIALRSRLKLLIKEIGTRKKAAELGELSEEMLRRYTKDSRIALIPVGKMCQAANISLDWLFCGEGNKYKNSQPNEPNLVKEPAAKYAALAEAMTHAPNGYRLPSKLTALILELVSDYDVNPAAINRIIEVIAELNQEKITK